MQLNKFVLIHKSILTICNQNQKYHNALNGVARGERSAVSLAT